jgi:hypothetical protein
MIDKYTKAMLTVIAVALVLVAGRQFTEPTVASAGAFKDGERIAVPGEPRSIPKSWGRLVSVISQGQGADVPGIYFYFEASDGVIRRAFSGQVSGVLVERGAWMRK